MPWLDGSSAADFAVNVDRARLRVASDLLDALLSSKQVGHCLELSLKQPLQTFLLKASPLTASPELTKTLPNSLRGTL